MVRKKTGKWFEDENIQRITVKGGKIYILEKNIYTGKNIYIEKNIYILEKNLVIPTEKIKRHAIGWSKEKNTFRAVKLQCKKCSIYIKAIYIYIYIYIYDSECVCVCVCVCVHAYI